jgi:peptide deformylase
VTRLQIRIFGDPVLRQRAHEVEDFDARLTALAADMQDTMRAAEGVGLAANQVGVLKRMFTWELEVERPDDEDERASDDREPEFEVIGGAVVNPVLRERSAQVQEGDEGCLSFPGLFYPVERPLRVSVDYQDLLGAAHSTELEGFLARVWLHEMDHLDGILFVDHLAKHDRREALKRMRESSLESGSGGQATPAPGSLLLGRQSL